MIDPRLAPKDGREAGAPGKYETSRVVAKMKVTFPSLRKKRERLGHPVLRFLIDDL
jgi:hypothetical protein